MPNLSAHCPRGALVYFAILTCIFRGALPAYAAALTDDSQPYVISTNVNLVVLPVTVTDRQHQFVSGLDASQFRVYEEGRLQMLSLFKNEDIPVAVGLVVDHSGSMDARKTDVLNGATAFVRASNSEDEEFVVNFSGEILLGLPRNVPFTNNLEALRAALSVAPASGMTALYDAIAEALDHLRNAPKEKKVLILITDGEDNVSHHYFDQILRMARELNVLIYSVGLFDTDKIENARDSHIEEELKLQFDQDKAVLLQLAKDTGAAAFFPKDSDEVISVCRQIASDIRHQYTLGYSPKDGRGGYRKVHVKVVVSGQGKLVVRTKAGYFLPSKEH
jgi:Ca-activated chloride channel homolog